MATTVKSMFEERSQTRNWLLNRNQIEKMRRHSNNEFHRKFGLDLGVKMRNTLLLDPAEERLLLTAYEIRLRDFCHSFKPCMPANVKGTAFHYFKRFYLNHTPMQYDPKLMLYTSVYLACKVEEFHVSLKRFLPNINGEPNQVRRDILAHEILLLQAINFEVNIHNPYRPVNGLLSLLKKHNFNADADRFHIHTEFFLNKMFLTDACLLHPPSQIAFAAVLYSAKKLGLNLDKYVIEILKEDNAYDQLSTLIEEVSNVRRTVKLYKEPKTEILAVVEEKQKKCYDLCMKRSQAHAAR